MLIEELRAVSDALDLGSASDWEFDAVVCMEPAGNCFAP